VYCASCGGLLGRADPEFPCPEWHNHGDPYCLGLAYPGRAEPNRQDPDTDDGLPVGRKLLSQLTAMGFPERRAWTALLETNNQNIDAAMDWLDMNQPVIPEPDPDATRYCFFGELRNIEAKAWIRQRTISVMMDTQELSDSICCDGCMAANALVELEGDERFFTVKNIPLRAFVGVRYEEAAEDGEENQRPLDEEEEFAEMVRRMEIGIWPYEEV
jgi:hypothetical protein